MIRKKELVLVSHCVLNQNAVINDWERAQGGFNTVVRQLLDQNVGILQLPCPELAHLGCKRPPMSKEEYNTEDYRKLCTQLANSQLETLLEYLENDYKLLGLIGIENSPTCDTLHEKGVFMEIFLEKCEEHDIQIKSIDIPEEYAEGETEFKVQF